MALPHRRHRMTPPYPPLAVCDCVNTPDVPPTLDSAVLPLASTDLTKVVSTENGVVMKPLVPVAHSRPHYRPCRHKISHAKARGYPNDCAIVCERISSAISRRFVASLVFMIARHKPIEKRHQRRALNGIFKSKPLNPSRSTGFSPHLCRGTLARRQRPTIGIAPGAARRGDAAAPRPIVFRYRRHRQPPRYHRGCVISVAAMASSSCRHRRLRDSRFSSAR